VRVRGEVVKGSPLIPVFDGNLTDGTDGDGVSEEERKRQKETEIYQRFLNGEDISDDEGEVEEPTSSDEDEEDSVDGEEGEDEEEGSAEAIGLFADFLRSTSGHYDAPSPVNSNHQSGEMVLAHLMHGGTGESPGPLTRRRWNALVRNEYHVGQRPSYDQGALEVEDDESFELSVARRTTVDEYESGRDSDAEMERRYHGTHDLCVICTTEGRDIICWPCRYVFPATSTSFPSIFFCLFFEILYMLIVSSLFQMPGDV
jgi:hypothetical protein